MPRRDEPRVLWQHAPEGASFDGLIAARGVVFALDRAGKVQALEAPTGRVLWTSPETFPFDFGFGLALSVSPDFDAIFVGCDDGLRALDRKSGRQLWHREIPLGVAGPACAKGVVVAAGADGKIYGCKLTTGEVLYAHDILADRPEDPPGFSGESARFPGRPARPGTAATDGLLVAVPVFDQCRVVALDLASGERRWTLQTSGWVGAEPTIGERHVYVASQDEHVYAVDRKTGELAWQVRTRARNEGSVALVGDMAVFGSCDAWLYGVGAADGEVTWRYETDHEKGRGAPIYSRPIVYGDRVYLAAMNGKVHVVDRHTGAFLAKLAPVPDSELNSDIATTGGLLFVTTRKAGEKGESAVVALTMR